MSLLLDSLCVWEIAYRWAGYDPDKIYIRIPLPVRDNFRLLIYEIYNSHLESESLSMDKYYGDDPLEAIFHIRYWSEVIKECISSKKYNKDFLQFVLISRMQMLEWCQRHKVPLPEFWFPPGWGLVYEWPDDIPEEQKIALPGETTQKLKIRLDDRHRIEMACKQVALSLWAKNLKLTIKEIVFMSEIQDLAGGSNFEPETVQAWIGEVDPRNPSKKRGPKRKNNLDSENPDPS